jgi:hypothetical protein
MTYMTQLCAAQNNRTFSSSSNLPEISNVNKTAHVKKVLAWLSWMIESLMQESWISLRSQSAINAADR